MYCRVLQKQKCEITQGYKKNHQGIDLVGEKYTLDKVVSHSKGTIIYVQDGYDNLKGSIGAKSYGNYIRIDHGNGFDTIYAHLGKGISLKKGDIVNKGTVLGEMSDSGDANGKHLHFEVLKNDVKINPTNYLNSDLYKESSKNEKLTYEVGNKVVINGVYISSTSNERLIPAIKEGTITKVIEDAKNPYLLDDGKIGWVNDETIVEIKSPIKTEYYQKPSYNGFSIVDALKAIKVDSSFENRKKIATTNEIKNYTGTAIQNNYMLELLKQGKLKK